MHPILLSPAGSFEALEAALQNGADAVYFGVGKLNMRAQATVNFQPDDLPEIARCCHLKNKKAWLALNTVIFDAELKEVKRLCALAKEAGIDAVIAMDPAVIQTASALGLPVHLSVQANISNLEAVKFHSRYADVVVLARELTLEQIAHICREIKKQDIRGPSGEPVGVEIFVHGALCVAISGKCQMSLAAFNTSANRGECYQNCRRKYIVRDSETGTEFMIENQYVMSPKDLCAIPFLDRILESGVAVLKIEGRGRSADYVARTTAVYREAVELWKQKKTFTPEKIAEWEKRLGEVFNRGFWKGGYYLGHKLGEWAASGENQATRKKEFIGTVVNYFPKAKAAEVHLTSGSLEQDSLLLITGNATGAVEFHAGKLRVDDRDAASAPKGSNATFLSETKLRQNDKVYKLEKIKERGSNG